MTSLITHMPKVNGFSCLQVWIDTFTGWIEDFPCCSEQAKEVVRIVIHEIISRFGLLGSLQSDNSSAYKAIVTQRVSKSYRNRISLTLFQETSNLRKG